MAAHMHRSMTLNKLKLFPAGCACVTLENSLTCSTIILSLPVLRQQASSVLLCYLSSCFPG